MGGYHSGPGIEPVISGVLHLSPWATNSRLQDPSNEDNFTGKAREYTVWTYLKPQLKAHVSTEEVNNTKALCCSNRHVEYF